MTNARGWASSTTAGFSLVEVAVAMIVLVLALVPLAGLSLSLSSQRELSTTNRRVLERSISLIEEIRGVAPENVLATYHNTTYNVPDVVGANPDGTTLTVTVVSSNLGKILTVTVTGAWEAAGATHGVTLETVIYNPLG